VAVVVEGALKVAVVVEDAVVVVALTEDAAVVVTLVVAAVVDPVADLAITLIEEEWAGLLERRPLLTSNYSVTLYLNRL
jgi:hypothetical protein